MSTISRRAFLKTLGVGALSVAAVSVLAGCDTIPTQPTDPVEPGVTGVSADVKARVEAFLDKKLSAYITFADSSALDDDLKGAVEYAGVLDIMPQYVLCDDLTQVDWSIVGRLENNVDVTETTAADGKVTPWNIGSKDVLTAAEAVDTYQIDDARGVAVRAISSAIGTNAINQKVAEMIATSVNGYLYSLPVASSAAEGGNYNHNYTVSVSTYTKKVNSSSVGIGGEDLDVLPNGVTSGSVGAADPAVTFVAVQVVRTSSHQ